MGCNAWMGCTMTVHGHENDDAAREWCEAGVASADAEGNTTLSFEWDDAGYFGGALEILEDSLRSLPLPLEAWSCHVRYEYFDEPSADGSFCEFDIVGGKMENFKESRIEMVDAEPWGTLDLTPESETGFKCPKCGQAEEFDAFAVVLNGRTRITADGWDYTAYANDVELHPSSLMECGKCHHVQHQAFFMEEE